VERSASVETDFHRLIEDGGKRLSEPGRDRGSTGTHTSPKASGASEVLKAKKPLA
jgi:hypothetical protein